MTTWEFYVQYTADKHKDAAELLAADFSAALSDEGVELDEVQEGWLAVAFLSFFDCRRVEVDK